MTNKTTSIALIRVNLTPGIQYKLLGIIYLLQVYMFQTRNVSNGEIECCYVEFTDENTFCVYVHDGHLCDIDLTRGDILQWVFILDTQAHSLMVLACFKLEFSLVFGVCGGKAKQCQLRPELCSSCSAAILE